MDTLQTSLLASTYTVTALYHRIGVVQQLIEHVYYTAGADTSATLSERYQAAVAALPDADQRVVREWGEDWLLAVDEHTVHQFTTALREWVDTLPTMTIYVPVRLDETAAASIGTWCRAELADDMMMELLVDPAVVGGCAVIKEYTYHDLSLRTKLAAQPTVIPDIVGSYE